MAELDELLSTTLKRIAPPAESSGVAEAIRARVEAGDAGISAASSTAPGWGGGGAAGWLPWIGVVVVAGLVGGGVGVSGVAGAQTDEVAVVGHTAVLDGRVDAQSCPGGPTVRELTANTRVLAVARSEEPGYLGVRNPDDVASTIWVPAGAVVPDAGTDPSTLPVGESCPTLILAEPIPVVVEPEPEPTTPAPQLGPADTSAPKISQFWVTPDAFVVHDCGAPANTALIHVTGTDNVLVTGGTATWSGVTSGSSPLSSSGPEWQLNYVVPAGTGFGDINFTIRLNDAAGNQSLPIAIKIRNDSCPI